MLCGDLALASMSTPKYLNYVHYYNSHLFTYTLPAQCSNITSVFFVFITRSLALQKVENTETSFYSDCTYGAISTISSAKASINRLRPAIVNSLHWDLVYVF